jgi:hypothetical protein
MPDFDFGNIVTLESHEWPKRGRAAKPLDENLLRALRISAEQGTTPVLKMSADEVVSFGNILNKAGIALNLRIERHIVENGDGTVMFHFRARGKRNKDVE